MTDISQTGLGASGSAVCKNLWPKQTDPHAAISFFSKQTKRLPLLCASHSRQVTDPGSRKTAPDHHLVDATHCGNIRSSTQRRTKILHEPKINNFDSSVQNAFFHSVV